MMLKLWFLDSAAVAHSDMVSHAPFATVELDARGVPFFAAEVEELLRGGAELDPPNQSVLKQPACRSLEPQDIDQALVAEIGMLTPNVSPKKLAKACLVFRSVYFGAYRTLLK
jgi:hypothetical protein